MNGLPKSATPLNAASLQEAVEYVKHSEACGQQPLVTSITLPLDDEAGPTPSFAPTTPTRDDDQPIHRATRTDIELLSRAMAHDVGPDGVAVGGLRVPTPFPNPRVTYLYVHVRTLSRPIRRWVNMTSTRGGPATATSSRQGGGAASSQAGLQSSYHQHRNRPAFVPRCASATPVVRSAVEKSMVGASVEPNVSAEHLSVQRASWFRANGQRHAAGRLGKPLWDDQSTTSNLAQPGAESPTGKRPSSKTPSHAAAGDQWSPISRHQSTVSVGHERDPFDADKDALGRFRTVSRPASALSRPASALARPASAASLRPAGAGSSPSPARGRLRPASAALSRAADGGDASAATKGHHQLTSSTSKTSLRPAAGNERSSRRLRTIGEMQRELRNEAAARDVSELSSWQPRPAESTLFAGTVVGRYRTAVNNGNNFTMWDLAIEPPIARDERVRAEMVKIFESGDGDKDAGPATSAGVPRVASAFVSEV